MRPFVSVALALAAAGIAAGQERVPKPPPDPDPVVVDARDFLDLRGNAERLRLVRAKYHGQRVALTAQYAGRGERDRDCLMAAPVVVVPRGARVPVLKSVSFRVALTEAQRDQVYRAAEESDAPLPRTFFTVEGTARVDSDGLLSLADVKSVRLAPDQPAGPRSVRP